MEYLQKENVISNEQNVKKDTLSDSLLERDHSSNNALSNGVHPSGDVENGDRANVHLTNGDPSGEKMVNGHLPNYDWAKGNLHKITYLADRIKANAEQLAKFANDEGREPSLGVDGQQLLIPDAEKDLLLAKTSLLDDMKELQCLIKGPVGILMDIGANDILCLQAIYRFKIAQNIGQQEQVDYAQLSKRCGLNPKDLQRILRYAMTNFIFCEPRAGFVAHTAVSQTIAQDGPMQDFVGNVCEIRFPASAYAVDALEKYGVSHDPNQSGFSLSRNTARGLYDELSHYPKEARRWDGAMTALAQQINMDFVPSSFLKTTKADASPLIVDVGGGRGNISISLAESLPHASFIVQDIADTALVRGREESTHLGDRIDFQAYDFRTSQQVIGADFYYFRNIFHNWPDQACINIFRNHIPALKSGAQLIIDDFTLYEPGSLPWSAERLRRWMDINMLVFFGSRERTLSDWRELLEAADPRLKLVDFDVALDQPNTILRVAWEG